MAVNGDFIQGYGAGKAAGMSQKVAKATTEWLEENVDPETGYVLDSSLTVDNAAANAKAVGDILFPLNAEVDDLIKSAVNQKAPVIIDTASGAIASFEDGADNMPLKSLLVNIEPVQAAGTPTPETPLPISGWTGVNVTRTGVNVWDEEWELGGINTNGIPYADNTGIRAKNYIAVKPNTTYYRKSPASWNFCLYDMDKNFIEVQYNRNVTFTTPSNCYFLRFSMASVYGMTYNHDISINYPATDAQYHPYTGNTYDITFPSEAGAVYGGTLDVLTGLLTIKRFGICFDTAAKIDAMGSFSDNRLTIRTNNIPYPRIKSKSSQLCSHAVYQSDAGKIRQSSVNEAQFQVYPFENRIFFAIPGVDSLQGYQDFATEQMNAGTPLTFVSLVDQSKYITYQLSPIEVATLLGENNIWADCGDVSVDYPADTKLFIQKVNKPTDDDMTADTQIASGKYFIIGNNLYLSTTTIPAGDTIIPGTNCTKTDLAAALNALNT